VCRWRSFAHTAVEHRAVLIGGDALRGGDRVCRPDIVFVLPERDREPSPCQALDAAVARSNNAGFVQPRRILYPRLRAEKSDRTEMRGNIMLL